MKFLDRRSNEIKEAYEIRIREEKAYVRFKEGGKEYAYHKENIELIEDSGKADCPFVVYRLMKECYKCRKQTSVLTYIVFDDGTDEDVVFPWDNERLLENQHIFSHMQDPSIEYYGLKVVGDDDRLDHLLMKKFPNKIQCKYSRVQQRSYPMNLCDHCGAIQGWNYIYRQVNEMIKGKQEIRKYYLDGGEN